MAKDNQNITEEPKRPTSHRVIAWVCIVLLLSMYTITFISAVSGGGSTSALFMMSLGSTILIPCVLWGYMCLWKWSVNRNRKKIMAAQAAQEAGDADNEAEPETAEAGEEAVEAGDTAVTEAAAEETVTQEAADTEETDQQ